MTDLETACRELVDRWDSWLPPEDAMDRPIESHVRECKRELEEALAEHTPGAAERLAAQTGEPKEKFEAGDKPIPEVEGLDPDVKDLVEQMEDAT